MKKRERQNNQDGLGEHLWFEVVGNRNLFGQLALELGELQDAFSLLLTTRALYAKRDSLLNEAIRALYRRGATPERQTRSGADLALALLSYADSADGKELYGDKRVKIECPFCGNDAGELAKRACRKEEATCSCGASFLPQCRYQGCKFLPRCSVLKFLLND